MSLSDIVHLLQDVFLLVPESGVLTQLYANRAIVKPWPLNNNFAQVDLAILNHCCIYIIKPESGASPGLLSLVQRAELYLLKKQQKVQERNNFQ